MFRADMQEYSANQRLGSRGGGGLGPGARSPARQNAPGTGTGSVVYPGGGSTPPQQTRWRDRPQGGNQWQNRGQWQNRFRNQMNQDQAYNNWQQNWQQPYFQGAQQAPQWAQQPWGPGPQMHPPMGGQYQGFNQGYGQSTQGGKGGGAMDYQNPQPFAANRNFGGMGPSGYGNAQGKGGY